MRLALIAGMIFTAFAASGEERSLDSYLWEARPVVVFADSPKDPRFVRQMENFSRRMADMKTRDVVLLTDTDPSADGPLREALRPTGFAMILIGKDGEIKLRAPHPMSVDALTRLIDRMPMRQQEIEERRGE